MAARNANYDFLFKLLLIGESGAGKSCLLLRFSDDCFTTSFITTIGIDFKIKTIQLGPKTIKLQIWDTAGQERFRTITTAYYRGAHGILLVYDVGDEQSFQNIRNWIATIKQHASDKVEKIILANKCDIDDAKKVISTQRGQALADEYGMVFFETSAKTGLNVTEAFNTVVTNIQKRVTEEEQATLGSKPLTLETTRPTPKSNCCK